VLPDDARARLRQLAQQRGTASIEVTGYGDATSAAADAQTAALPLAWSRAQAISGVLQDAGVPPAALRITAEAGGHGGVARIAN
jgi:outer membrane protein OmpA-like peptidoglycan-associated protein